MGASTIWIGYSSGGRGVKLTAGRALVFLGMSKVLVFQYDTTLNAWERYYICDTHHDAKQHIETARNQKTSYVIYMMHDDNMELFDGAMRERRFDVYELVSVINGKQLHAVTTKPFRWCIKADKLPFLFTESVRCDDDGGSG